MVIKKTNGTKKSGPKQNKAAFVRSLPTDLPAKEVVDRAKAVGLSFSDKYVYNIRHSAKVAAKGKGAPARAARAETPVVARRVGRPPSARPAVAKPVAPKAPVAAAPRPHTGSGTGAEIEELLRAAAAELGLGRAISILESERAKVRAVFRA